MKGCETNLKYSKFSDWFHLCLDLINFTIFISSKLFWNTYLRYRSLTLIIQRFKNCQNVWNALISFQNRELILIRYFRCHSNLKIYLSNIGTKIAWRAWRKKLLNCKAKWCWITLCNYTNSCLDGYDIQNTDLMSCCIDRHRIMTFQSGKFVIKLALDAQSSHQMSLLVFKKLVVLLKSVIVEAL